MSDHDLSIWPFLVCRGRTVGSRVVVTPEILSVGQQLSRLLAHRPLDADRWVVPGEPAGLVVVARDVVIDGSWLGSSAPIQDVESRPIRATQGAIIRGGRLDDDEVLAEVQRVVRGPFADFWQADDPGWEPRLSSGTGALVEVPAPWQVRVRPPVPAPRDPDGILSPADAGPSVAEPELETTPGRCASQMLAVLALGLAVSTVVFWLLMH